MAISYPRSLPNVPIKSIRMGLNINQSFFKSGLSRQTSIQGHAGGTTDSWEGMLTTTTLSKAQVQELSAWITSLRGQEGTFTIFDPDRKMPTGVATTANSIPKIKGASQVGRTLTTDGWQLSTVGILDAGDYIQIDDQYFMIMESVDSDVNGEAIINVEPALRSSPINNRSIIIENPVLIARMVEKNQSWETDSLALGSYSFAWEEVI
jgi:hypothetical protein